MSNNLYQAPKKVGPGEPLPSEESGWVWILFQFRGRVYGLPRLRRRT